MQTILGAGGAIGVELAKVLPDYTDTVRLVSRTPRRVNPGDELHAADLTRPEEVSGAVEGSEIIYLTVGLPYKFKVWQEIWPALMHNVIEACKIHGTKLVFFDNIYMYHPDYLPALTEETPVQPVSKKGAIRAAIAGMIWKEVSRGNLEALIARSADFYGPSIADTSVLTEMVFEPLSQGKKANWLGSDTYKHSFTYTPDAAKATAILGNTPEVYNQVWHLPTAADPPTGKEWIQGIAREMNVQPKYRVASKLMVRLMGIFMPVMRELVEMMYQYQRDYVFNSSKFDQRFDLTPTSYAEGIREIVRVDYSD